MAPAGDSSYANQTASTGNATAVPRKTGIAPSAIDHERAHGDARRLPEIER